MKKKIVSIAPGRTCLFGDHQDYIGLPIIACAIDRYIKLVAEENNSTIFNIRTPDIDKERNIFINNTINDIEKGDHLLSVLKVVKEYGCIPDRGFDITISGNLPINAGISSSSAVVVSWIKFLLEAFGSRNSVTPEYVSQIAYEAEVLEQGSPGGKMDQYSIGLGNVLYLETGNDFNYELIHKPIKGLIIGESGIPKETIGVLKELKEKAWLAIHKIKETDKDFDIQKAQKKDLDTLQNYLPDRLYPYLYAAISNHDITQKALRVLKRKHIDFEELGSLMNEHHQILRDVLKITVPKIDNMIDSALDAGAYGAKIVGSGRGGSIVVLASEGKEQKIINAIIDAGGKDAYRVNVDKGARILNNPDIIHKKLF
ncbi:mevalonate kinase family protein [Aquimarina longa]|uniref:mevalonate kinase family protein n=1 Tax=Aquimarina longa TaxID=1080221 RepID=UPI0007867A14|nr:galactokinase family protein [Aquimarina longa]